MDFQSKRQTSGSGGGIMVVVWWLHTIAGKIPEIKSSVGDLSHGVR